MTKYASDVIESLKAAARDMAQQEEVIRKVPFGKRSGFVWLSSDRNKVVVDEIIVVDGKEFFIGLFTK